MPDLLFEIGTEELPSWYVTQGREALASGVSALLSEARIGFESLRSFGTPRRLAVIVSGVAQNSDRVLERRRGPAESAGYGVDGQLSKAALAFAAAAGVAPESLTVEETERGRYLFATREVGGQPVREILPSLLGRVVTELPAPRKMRWADVDAQFVRPVAWLVALLDGEVLPVEAAGQQAGRSTFGHRFLAPGALELATPSEYERALEEAQVMPAEEERRAETWRQVGEVAGREGLKPLPNEELLSEVANLVEMPVPVLGAFDDDYLELPEEVLVTVMIHHQRYFPLRFQDGRLANRFVSISNNRVPDESVIRSGYEKVLDGRLHDAAFFWRSDRAKSLSQHAWDLSGIQFHKELGSMADKVSRVGDTARRLAVRLKLPESAKDVLEQALPVFRADLGTDMVFEFPELEGVMARAYALAEGLSPEVGQALEDGVRPKGPEDGLPVSDAGALLSIADRADKLIGFFAVGRRVTGSADPYGLRRDALALVRVMTARGWALAPRELLEVASEPYRGGRVVVDGKVLAEVEAFLWDRLASLLSTEGMSVQQVRAATAGGPAFITAAHRAHLLKALERESGFPELLTLYKRAANLAEKAPVGTAVDVGLFATELERPLFESVTRAREGVGELLDLARENLGSWDPGRDQPGQLPALGAAMAKVLDMKEPLDRFLDNVLVMVDDEAVRENRLTLLREVRDSLRPLGHLEELTGG